MEYRIVWTFVANHGTMIVDAPSPEIAAKRCFEGFSTDFQHRGTVYVFPLATSQCYSGYEYLTELKGLKA